MTGVLEHRGVDPALLHQICHEYVDLPGLRLTVAQASRLLAIDTRDGQALLDELVNRAFLRRSGVHYVRAES